jgi:hypothetical protein
VAARISALSIEGWSLMASAEDHRRNASECLRMSQRIKDPAAKALLLTMAERWLRLAQEIEAKDDENSN